MQEMHIGLLNFTEESYEEKEISIDELCALDLEQPIKQWITIEGIHDIKKLERIGKTFGIHMLVLEDILNTGQRPKIENHESYAYIIVKVLSYNQELEEFISEQESFILGENYVISFSETKSKNYNTVRERIRQGTGHIRKMGMDYLVYSLLDVIVDNYFVVLEELGERIELVEDELIFKPSPETLQGIHRLKRQMLYLHKAIWPLRELVSSIERNKTDLFTEPTEIYVRDLYDHVIQIMDTSETFREILSSMLDMYLSSISNRMNEVMKVLTMISTIFIPLSFIVGLYGMNITNMPEYNWRWTYPVLWLIMLGIAAFMLGVFKKKKWW